MASDEFKKQVAHSHGCFYVIEHLPISFLGDDSTVELLEEPGKFLLRVALESRLTPPKRPSFEPRCKKKT
jgi:hypothetical protein